MSLQNFQIKQLKKLAHPLPPVVNVGKDGIKPSLLKEVTSLLHARELIKVKFYSYDRNELRELAENIAKQSHSHLVQVVGKIATFYRQSPEQKIL